jgi:hypothetical protein
MNQTTWELIGVPVKGSVKPAKRFLYASIIAGLLVSGCYGLNGPKQPSGLALAYHNTQYDFTFFLPADWQGYSVLTEQWNGQASPPAADTTAARDRGPVIVLRHPQWTAAEPCQDIPILVFTRSQWKADREGRFSIFAGGVEGEVAHNAKYVFAIWSRFNWDESVKGAREAEGIVFQNQTANRPHLDPN